MKDMNSKINTIQTKNGQWKHKLGLVQKDVEDVKISVELAHNMIQDEQKDREKSKKDIWDVLNEKSKEMCTNVQLMKTQIQDMKDTKETVKALQLKVGSVVETQTH